MLNESGENIQSFRTSQSRDWGGGGDHMLLINTDWNWPQRKEERQHKTVWSSRGTSTRLCQYQLVEPEQKIAWLMILKAVKRSGRARMAALPPYSPSKGLCRNVQLALQPESRTGTSKLGSGSVSIHGCSPTERTQSSGLSYKQKASTKAEEGIPIIIGLLRLLMVASK